MYNFPNIHLLVWQILGLYSFFLSFCNFFDSAHERIDMITTDPLAIDYPYPTTNIPPLITHHAFNVCEALRRVCPCDDARDAKEDDYNSDMFT